MSENDEEAQVAAELLYEDESLRDNLTDDQATPLLTWATKQIGGAGEALEDAQEGVRSVLKLVNKAAAQDGSERQETLSKLPELLDKVPGDTPPPLPAELAAPDDAPPPLPSLPTTAKQEQASSATPAANTLAADTATTALAEPAATEGGDTAAKEQAPATGKLNMADLQPEPGVSPGISAPPVPQPAAPPAPQQAETQQQTEAPQPAPQAKRKSRRIRWGYHPKAARQKKTAASQEK